MSAVAGELRMQHDVQQATLSLDEGVGTLAMVAARLPRVEP